MAASAGRKTERVHMQEYTRHEGQSQDDLSIPGGPKPFVSTVLAKAVLAIGVLARGVDECCRVPSLPSPLSSPALNLGHRRQSEDCDEE